MLSRGKVRLLFHTRDGSSQLEKDLSIEQVAALASQNNLPEPSLDLSALGSNPSTFSSTLPPTLPRSPAPTYSSDDPWNSPFRSSQGYTNGSTTGTISTSLSGGGLPPDWWKRQETVAVNMVGQQGFLLNRHMVYSITTNVGFIWLCSFSQAIQ